MNSPDPAGATATHPPGSLLSIGDLAEATGISTHTIRVWERRYGRPQPVRLPSGQRRYTDQHVRWMRRVAEALAHGHRAAEAVAATEAELERMRGTAAEPPGQLGGNEHLLEAVRALDGAALRAQLADAQRRLGPRAWIDQVIAPLATAVGRAWADGRLSVNQEHYCSEVLEDFLRAQRAACAPAAGPRIVLATLAEEEHVLGLQMAALVCALQGFQVELLGRNTPLAEIARAAETLRAGVVAISVSLATGGIETDRRLAELRRALPGSVRLIIGGAGARGVRRGPRGIEYAADFAAFEQWLRSLRSQA